MESNQASYNLGSPAVTAEKSASTAAYSEIWRFSRPLLTAWLIKVETKLGL